MATRERPGDGWTAVLRRQPAHIVEGRPEGGYTDLFEIICCDCGDHPYLDYSEVPPELRRIRGPYPMADGIRIHSPLRGAAVGCDNWVPCAVGRCGSRAAGVFSP